MHQNGRRSNCRILKALLLHKPEIALKQAEMASNWRVSIAQMRAEEQKKWIPEFPSLFAAFGSRANVLHTKFLPNPKSACLFRIVFVQQFVQNFVGSTWIYITKQLNVQPRDGRVAARRCHCIWVLLLDFENCKSETGMRHRM